MKKNIFILATCISFISIPKTYYGQFHAINEIADISLMENNAPKIVTHPNSQTLCVGSNANFSVNASGSKLTYQWRKGLINIYNDVSISGATSSVLTISDLSFLNEADDYNVIVNGSYSPNVVSLCASLVVNEAPFITSQPISQTVCAGFNVSFPVVSSGPGLRYQWRKGDTLLVNDKYVSGANSSQLTLSKVTAANIGTNYNVVITGLCASSVTSRKMSLAILTPPTIITQPVSKVICANGSVNFVVSTIGSGLKYQWRKGTEPLCNGASVSGVTKSKLTIATVNVSDTAKNYNVVISGSCGSKINSTHVTLGVLYNPLIISQPISQTNSEGNCITFDVLATGSDLTYQWRRGEKKLSNGINIIGANSAILILHAIHFSDVDSNYNVIVSGKCPIDQTSVNVSLATDTLPIIATKHETQ